MVTHGASNRSTCTPGSTCTCQQSTHRCPSTCWGRSTPHRTRRWSLPREPAPGWSPSSTPQLRAEESKARVGRPCVPLRTTFFGTRGGILLLPLFLEKIEIEPSIYLSWRRMAVLDTSRRPSHPLTKRCRCVNERTEMEQAYLGSQVDLVPPSLKILPQVTTVTCRGSLPPEKKRARVAHSPELRPPFERAQAKRAHLKVALLAETRGTRAALTGPPKKDLRRRSAAPPEGRGGG